jgi:hypothetical protein
MFKPKLTKNNLYVQVTPKHIKNGEPNNRLFCPIALAIKDQVKGKGLTSVSVEGTQIVLTFALNPDSPNFFRFFVCHASAQNFINEVDDRKQVKPQNFIFQRKGGYGDWIFEG